MVFDDEKDTWVNMTSADREEWQWEVEEEVDLEEEEEGADEDQEAQEGGVSRRGRGRSRRGLAATLSELVALPRELVLALGGEIHSYLGWLLQLAQPWSDTVVHVLVTSARKVSDI